MTVSNYGCDSVRDGLRGIGSIAEAMRPAAVVGHGQQFSSEQITVAMQKLPLLQKLNTETRAVHAAAFWNVTSGIVALREGRRKRNTADASRKRCIARPT